MKRIIAWLFVAVILSTVLAAQSTEQPQRQLSELSRLRAENLKLKAQLNSCSLSVEQINLEMSFRKELDAKETDAFNWTSFTFTNIK